MIRRLFSIGLLLGLLVAGDFAARGFVESTVNTRAKQETPPGSSVRATIGGFPFVPPLLLSGEVSTATVHIENLDATVIVFAEVDIDLRGVKLDRGRLINDRKARITAIDHGKVTAAITEEALRSALPGNPKVDIDNGRLEIAGVRITPTARDGRVSILGLTLPVTDYVPCATDVEFKDDRMEVSCEIEDVPKPLLDVVQDAVDP